MASTFTRSVRTALTVPIESWTVRETSWSPAQGKTTENSGAAPVAGNGSQPVDPAGGEAFQDHPETASPGSSSWLAVPRKSRGRFEPTDSGASMTATGAAFETHCPDRHQAPDGQGVDAEQLAISGRSPHPARATRTENKAMGALRSARVVLKGLPL